MGKDGVPIMELGDRVYVKFGTRAGRSGELERFVIYSAGPEWNRAFKRKFKVRFFSGETSWEPEEALEYLGGSERMESSEETIDLGPRSFVEDIGRILGFRDLEEE